MARVRRHRRSHRSLLFSPVVGLVLGLVVLALGVVGGTSLALRSSAESSCDHPLTLRVGTAPELTAAVGKIAAGYDARRPVVAGRCVAVEVTGVPSAGTADSLAAGTAGPDVWVPESTTWVALARATTAGGRAVPATSPIVASSPTVIAVPRPMATALGWPRTQVSWTELAADEGSTTVWAKAGHPTWGTFRVGFADPGSSVAAAQALVALTAVQERTAPAKLTAAAFSADRAAELAILDLERGAAQVPTTQQDLLAALRTASASGGTDQLSAFPAQESDVVAYNRGTAGGPAPKVPLVASYPADGLYDQQVPYVVPTATGADPQLSAAATAFLDELRSRSGQDTIMAAGFRSPTGASTGFTTALGVRPTLPAGVIGGGSPVRNASAGVFTAVQDFFARVHQRGATLAVFDLSGSMDDPVAGTDRTKFQIVDAAAVAGLKLFADNDLLGIWGFATDLDGTRGYKQFSPVVALDSKGATGTHRSDLQRLATVIAPYPNGNTALYETALAAYRARTQAYVPGRLNQVVLFTDGIEDDPGDPDAITLPQLLTDLKALYDPARPVQLITIAYGSEADPTVLKQISAVTHAKSYQSYNPSDITGVFFDALVRN